MTNPTLNQADYSAFHLQKGKWPISITFPSRLLLNPMKLQFAQLSPICINGKVCASLLTMLRAGEITLLTKWYFLIFTVFSSKVPTIQAMTYDLFGSLFLCYLCIFK